MQRVSANRAAAFWVVTPPLAPAKDKVTEPGPWSASARAAAILGGESGQRGAARSPGPAVRPGATGCVLGVGVAVRARGGPRSPTQLCSFRPLQVAMFSSIAPLARLNPFYTPHFQPVQDGMRKRAEPTEAPTTRRSLAAASAGEGESGREGWRSWRGHRAGKAPVPARSPLSRACGGRGGGRRVSAYGTRPGRGGGVL